jgi:hypothetical protein
MTFADKIKEFEKLGADPTTFPGMNDRPHSSEKVRSVAERLRIENDRRNDLLHSLMLPRLLDAGLPPHMSRRRKGVGTPTFEIVVYDHAKMKTVMEEIGRLALSLGMVHTQLVHWQR